MKAQLAVAVARADSDRDDRLVLFVEGDFYTIECDKHPRYRGAMAPTAAKCEICRVIWVLRKAARVMKEKSHVGVRE